MRICPACEKVNGDDRKYCQECQNSLAETQVTDTAKLAEEAIRGVKLREKHNRLIFRTLLVTYIALMLCLSVYALFMAQYFVTVIFGFLWPVLGFVLICFPEQLFRMNIALIAANPENVEPSDLYLFNTRAGGVILALLAPVLMLLCVMT